MGRYTCSKADSQLVKEIDGAVGDIRCCFKYCEDNDRAIEPLYQFIDSLCLWEEGGMRLVGKWSSQLVGLMSTAVDSKECLKLLSSMDCRSHKMRQLVTQGLWMKLPRSRATVLLLLEGEAVAQDRPGGEGVTGRSKRRRIAKVYE